MSDGTVHNQWKLFTILALITQIHLFEGRHDPIVLIHGVDLCVELPIEPQPVSDHMGHFRAQNHDVCIRKNRSNQIDVWGPSHSP
jgi:hypothetical protein